MLRFDCCSLVAESCPTFSDSMDCKPARLLCPWDFPGKNTGVGGHSLLQGIFPTQGSNPHLLHWRQILYHWTTSEALEDSMMVSKWLCSGPHNGHLQRMSTGVTDWVPRSALLSHNCLPAKCGLQIVVFSKTNCRTNSTIKIFLSILCNF